MCSQKISVRKYLKLLLQIYFYKITIYLCFLLAGYEILSFHRVVLLLMPFWGFGNDFVSCYLAFYLLIPFLAIWVKNLNRTQHILLLSVLLCLYTFLGTIPYFQIHFNYITWFCVIFILASFIRLHPDPLFESKKIWRLMTILSLLLAFIGIVSMHVVFAHECNFAISYYFVSDSNKLFALAVSICSFLWFKNMKVKQNRLVNLLGASTFGVLLIHTNSDAMRAWLWNDVVNVFWLYKLSFGELLLFSISIVILLFILCSVIDQLRYYIIEKPFFRWYDGNYNEKVESFLYNKLTNV